jgi:Zn-dependent protease/CBS domain-containing protein
MKWSFKLVTLRGIEVRMHLTFFILLGVVALSHWRLGHEPAQIAAALAFILALFTCVVLHELGHAFTAGHYGITTRDITLLPIGGVARLERMPEQPRQELWVALAGPAVNIVIASALYLWLSATGQLAPLASLSVTEGPFLERLMIVNVFLAAFNLLPAFPMDGGRVLRAVLATRLEYAHATQLAAGIGQALSLGLAFLGFLYYPFLIFFALFVWMGASQEAGLAQLKSAFNGLAVGQVMVTDFRTLAPDASLNDAVQLVLSGFQADIPVVEGEHVVGILMQSDMLAALSKYGHVAPVSAVMSRVSDAVSPDEMLDSAFGRLNSSGSRTLPVVQRGRLVGLLSLDNIGEFIAIQGALQGRRKGAEGILPSPAILRRA